MNIISIKKVALGLALSATFIGAKAQKTYTQGKVTYTFSAAGNSADAPVYFTADSSALISKRGPATIKMITNKAGDFFAVMVDVPVASMKKAAVATPAELDDAQANEPQYAFTKTDEVKKIGDYNCKKYTAKDARDGATYELWVTNDVTLPPNLLTKAFSSLGTPVQFTYLQMGNAKMAQQVTLKSISDDKAPANMFVITPDYDKISLTDMQNLGKGRQ